MTFRVVSWVCEKCWVCSEEGADLFCGHWFCLGWDSVVTDGNDFDFCVEFVVVVCDEWVKEIASLCCDL